MRRNCRPAWRLASSCQLPLALPGESRELFFSATVRNLFPVHQPQRCCFLAHRPAVQDLPLGDENRIQRYITQIERGDTSLPEKGLKRVSPHCCGGARATTSAQMSQRWISTVTCQFLVDARCFADVQRVSAIDRG